ncbi:MAG: TRAP transporter small permease [Qingshengfaniella sp.]
MIEKAIIAFSLLNLVGLLGLTLYLVIARYLLDRSAAGASEVVLICAVQLYMSGSLLASMRGEHLRINLFGPTEAGRFRAILIAGVMLIVSLFFCWWSYRMLTWGLVRPQVTPSLGLPLWLPQSSIMVCSIGSVIVALKDLHRGLTRGGEARK